MNAVTGAEISYEKGRKAINVCLALEEMKKDAFAEGISDNQARMSALGKWARENDRVNEFMDALGDRERMDALWAEYKAGK